MSIIPDDFLTLAQELNNNSCEVRNRTAASRAYYCAYHACINLFQINIPREHQKGGMHNNFIQSLERSTNKNDRRIGIILRDIYNRRLLADYDLQTAFPESSSTQAIKQTQRLLEQLKTISDQLAN